MELGSLEQTVSVEAAAPLVETRNPAVGATITSEQIDALPLEGRSAVSLITLTGASADAGPSSSRSMTSSRGIAISGGQPFGVAYLLDGALHNNAYDGFNMPLPFPDALQEFKVETSTQNAQNGVHAGGTVSLVTKSGTNLLHGDVFEFARHHRFNAASPFAGLDPRPASASTTAWCATSSAACWAASWFRTSCSSSAPIRPRARRRPRLTWSRSCRRQR
jgi:hypothetical protein